MKISHLIKDKSLIKKLFPYSINDYLSINPKNNILEERFGYHSSSHINQMIKLSHLSFLDWKETSLQKRLEKMNNLSQILQKHKEVLASVITKEMGKPINDSEAEINKCINYIKFYQNEEYINSNIKNRYVKFGDFESTVHYQPIGPILCINPWNYPVFVPFKSIIPAMVAGNTILLKPAPCVPKTSLLLERYFLESGFDKDEFQVILSNNEQMEKEIIPDGRIRYVVFTGSTNSGSHIGALAGKNLKRSLLELGGSDPSIVLEDCDIDKAVQFAVEGRLRNAGQACICTKRIILMDSIYEEFMTKLLKEISKYKVGDPNNRDTKIGPMARLDLFLKLKEQVIKSVEGGAKLLNTTIDEIDTNYEISQGNFFHPVILTDVSRSCTAYNEELFGPVFNIFRVKNHEEALNLANDTVFGLGASVFTKNNEKAQYFSKNLDCGMVYINSSTFSDPNLPYGGTKNSGYGRTSAWEAFYEFTNHKVVSSKIN